MHGGRIMYLCRALVVSEFCIYRFNTTSLKVPCLVVERDAIRCAHSSTLKVLPPHLRQTFELILHRSYFLHDNIGIPVRYLELVECALSLIQCAATHSCSQVLLSKTLASSHSFLFPLISFRESPTRSLTYSTSSSFPNLFNKCSVASAVCSCLLIT